MVLYLEDVSAGDEFVSDELTVTVDQIIAFAKQYDPQPFHTDPDAAKDTFFGGLAASGWHTAALTMRLLVTGGPEFAGGIIGAGGQIQWPSPTRPDDRLHVKATVESVVPSKSRPDRGSVLLRVEAFTSNGELRQVFTARCVVLAKSEQQRPA
jgi:acyl dehydratase